MEPHLWSGLFPVPSRLALLVAKPIANAAAAPPRTTRRGRSLHPRLRGALPPRLPLSVVRCGDPSAHSFIRRQLVSSGNPRMASVVLKSWYGLSSQPDPSLLSLSLYSFSVLWISILRCAMLVQIHPSIHVFARFVWFFRLRIETLDFLRSSALQLISQTKFSGFSWTQCGLRNFLSRSCREYKQKQTPFAMVILYGALIY